MMKATRFILNFLMMVGLLLLPCSCETDSADTFIRDVSVNYSGFYQACEGNSAIVQANSGNRIRTLDLRQNGDQLEAVDNNGLIWRGQLGEPQSGRSSFELRGRTSTGIEGVFSGILSSSDGGVTNAGSADGTMTGTYIEPDRFSTFCGTATIPGSQGGGGGGGGGGVGTNTNTNLVISSIWRPGAAQLTLGACAPSFLRSLRN